MIVFFGSSVYSLPVLKSLSKFDDVALVTIPDRNIAHSQKSTPNPAAQFAQNNNFTVFKLDSLKDFPQSLKTEIGVCAVFGKIIPESLINKFKYGIINFHPSLLPKYRGPSPALGAIINKDAYTGYSAILMDKKVDHGPLIFQKKLKLNPEINSHQLYQKLFSLMGNEAPKIVEKYLLDSQTGKQTSNINPDGDYFYPPQEQNHKKASWTPLLKRGDGYLSPSSRLLNKALEGKTVSIKDTPDVFKKIYNKNKVKLPASYVVHRLNLAFSPWPGIWTIVKINGKNTRLKILETATENCKLVIKKVQLEGKKPTEFRQLQQAYALAF
jgi:methionyl-tRNA formyltransferase